MSKLENLMDFEKLNDLLKKKDIEISKLYKLLGRKEIKQEEEEQEEKKFNALLWILAIIGVVAAVAAISYAVYRYFRPDYLEDFDDDFEDDLEDYEIGEEDDCLYEDEE